MHRITEVGRGEAASAAEACPTAQPAMRVPVVLCQTVSKILRGVRPVTEARRVTGQLVAFRDPRLSGELATLIDPQPPLVFRAGAGSRGAAALPVYRPAAQLYWRGASFGPLAEPSVAVEALADAATVPDDGRPSTPSLLVPEPWKRSRSRPGQRARPAPAAAVQPRRTPRFRGYPWNARALATPPETAVLSDRDETLAVQESDPTGPAADFTAAAAVAGAAAAPTRRFMSWLRTAVSAPVRGGPASVPRGSSASGSASVRSNDSQPALGPAVTPAPHEHTSEGRPSVPARHVSSPRQEPDPGALLPARDGFASASPAAAGRNRDQAPDLQHSPGSRAPDVTGRPGRSVSFRAPVGVVLGAHRLWLGGLGDTGPRSGPESETAPKPKPEIEPRPLESLADSAPASTQGTAAVRGAVSRTPDASRMLLTQRSEPNHTDAHVASGTTDHAPAPDLAHPSTTDVHDYDVQMLTVSCTAEPPKPNADQLPLHHYRANAARTVSGTRLDRPARGHAAREERTHPADDSEPRTPVSTPGSDGAQIPASRCGTAHLPPSRQATPGQNEAAVRSNGPEAAAEGSRTGPRGRARHAPVQPASPISGVQVPPAPRMLDTAKSGTHCRPLLEYLTPAADLASRATHEEDPGTAPWLQPSTTPSVLGPGRCVRDVDEEHASVAKAPAPCLQAHAGPGPEHRGSSLPLRRFGAGTASDRGNDGVLPEVADPASETHAQGTRAHSCQTAPHTMPAPAGGHEALIPPGAADPDGTGTEHLCLPHRHGTDTAQSRMPSFQWEGTFLPSHRARRAAVPHAEEAPPASGASPLSRTKRRLADNAPADMSLGTAELDVSPALPATAVVLVPKHGGPADGEVSGTRQALLAQRCRPVARRAADAKISQPTQRETRGSGSPAAALLVPDVPDAQTGWSRAASSSVPASSAGEGGHLEPLAREDRTTGIACAGMRQAASPRLDGLSSCRNVPFPAFSERLRQASQGGDGRRAAGSLVSRLGGIPTIGAGARACWAVEPARRAFLEAVSDPAVPAGPTGYPRLISAAEVRHTTSPALPPEMIPYSWTRVPATPPRQEPVAAESTVVRPPHGGLRSGSFPVFRHIGWSSPDTEVVASGDAAPTAAGVPSDDGAPDRPWGVPPGILDQEVKG